MAVRPSVPGAGMGKAILYLTLLTIAGVFLFRYYQNNYADYTSVPQEMQITYMPSDFNFEFDEENALAVLTNPHRYRREFDDLVYQFNMAILMHVADRMGVADSTKVLIEAEYQKQHPFMKQVYFNDFTTIRDTSANLYEAWYDNENTGAAKAMEEVASKYTCFLVNTVIVGLLKSEGGKINVKGKRVDTPCGVAITESLRPMIRRLQDQAAVRDFTRSKGLMEERVETMIAELATMEVRDKKAINKTLQTKLLGFNVSSSDIEVSAISLMKVGFDLNEYFDISLNERNQTITITLAAPKILSHEVYPKIDKLDIGWMREVQSIDLNKNFNLLRSEFRREAIESDVFTKSEDQARKLLEMFFQPVVAGLNPNYKVAVQFQKRAASIQGEDLNLDLDAPDQQRPALSEETIPE